VNSGNSGWWRRQMIMRMGNGFMRRVDEELLMRRRDTVSCYLFLQLFTGFLYYGMSTLWDRSQYICTKGMWEWAYENDDVAGKCIEIQREGEKEHTRMRKCQRQYTVLHGEWTDEVAPLNCLLSRIRAFPGILSFRLPLLVTIIPFSITRSLYFVSHRRRGAFR
jgi:hypothetical protein